MPERSTLLRATMVAVVAAIGAVLLVFSLRDDAPPVAHDHADPTVAHPHEHEPTVAPAEAAVGRLGDTVQDANLRFTITDLEADVPAIQGADEFSVVPDASFTLVGLTVENTGPKPQRYFAEYTTGVVADGDEVESDYIATTFANEDNDAWIEEIAPGESINTVIVIDTDETLTAVVLREEATSSGVTVEL